MMKNRKAQLRTFASTETLHDHLVVVLISPRNPLNIGAAARAMSNFGFRQLRLVNPYDIAYREAKSAVGATALLKNATEYGSLAEAIADCSLVVGTTAARQRKLDHHLRSLSEWAEVVRAKLRSGRVALLFGSEKRGLSNRDFSWCHWLLRIPTREDHPSMNLGQAVAVCLFELSKQSRFRLTSMTQRAQAISEDVERVTETLVDALQTCGYLTPHLNASAEEKIRSFARRLALSKEDAQLLLGMLRQMKWKMTKAK
jgi:TrmH family RNA methyltransferase